MVKELKKRGGARPGAGMPKGYKTRKTLDKEAARAALRELVVAQLRPLVDAQVANAMGLKYLVVREKSSGKFLRVSEIAAKAAQGEEIIEVWEKDPCVQAFTDLMNRALDKPAEQEQQVSLHVTGGEQMVARLQAGRERVARERKRSA